jgi:6-phosphogluconolactonase (cycloisomerase 2 family)
LGALALVTGCPEDDDDTPGQDAGDAGFTDTGRPDSGADDTGIPDVGRPDTGAPDTGMPEMDAGEMDAAMDAGMHPPGPATDVLYVISNEPAGNNIIGFSRAADGNLTELPDSPFPTGGTGIWNDGGFLGVDDADSMLVASADGQFLFAVNPGSDDISVFRIFGDGFLAPVPGSPFPSGGIQPMSIGLVGANRLYVANKDQDPDRATTPEAPNYVGFDIDNDGSLTMIAGSAFPVIEGSSPTQALISPDGRFMFGDELFNPFLIPPRGALRSWSIGTNGMLTEAPGSPLAIPTSTIGPPAVLGLQVHPTERLLYAGFVLRNQVGVFEWNDTNGALTFTATAANGGQAVCWLVFNADASRMYTTNTADNSATVYDMTNPRQPVELQTVALRNPGPGGFTVPPIGIPNAVSSGPFQLALSPDGNFLYVLNERVTTDLSYTDGNVIHVLELDGNGLMTEASYSEIDLPTTFMTHPIGIVVF